MINITKNTGQIPNVFSKDDIEVIKKFLLKTSKTIGYQIGHHGDEETSEHYGADHKSITYPWIQKIIKPKLYKYFGDFNLVFISFNNSHKPFGIHSDESWHKSLDLPGKHFFSFLVPCSVDDIETNCNLASTIVFDEYSFLNKENNALKYQSSFLSHCLKEDLSRVEVKQRHIWNYGDFIWWDSNLLHTSGCFDGFKTKQCLVGHTYIE